MELAAVLRQQDGVVSRLQVLAAGLDDDDIARMLRRRELRPLYRGVYLEHTGTPTWMQRAWGATLLHFPSALAGRSALIAAGALPAEISGRISLVVPAHRRVTDPPGVVTTRTRRWDDDVLSHLSPPRVRLECAALAVAAESPTDDAAVALLGDLVQTRRTTAPRLRATLADLRRLPRRRLLEDVLSDVSSGSLSALERRYLREVERAHGLPPGTRQLASTHGHTRCQRDVVYQRQGTVIELDGRLGHELWADRWSDLSRDLHALGHGQVTLRLGWGQVLHPCRSAELVGRVLATRGWNGRPHACGAACPIA